MMISRRKLLLRSGGVVVGVLGLSFVGGIAVGYLKASGANLELDTAVFWILATMVAAVIMVGAIWGGALWMKAIDEAAREAHKAAWYWGGSSGMAVGGVLMILSSLPGAETLAIPTWLAGRTDPASYAATGALIMMGLMLVGYGIVWAWWWLGRR